MNTGGGKAVYDLLMISSPPILRQPGDLSLEWVEQALKRTVRTLEKSGAIESNWGSHTRLKVSLVDEPDPLRLHAKIASAATFGRAEVDYYTKHFVGLADAPLVRCHHADADASHYNLLLADLSETHGDQKVVEPTECYGRALVEAAAKLHAHHWPQTPPPDISHLEGTLSRARAGKDTMLDAMRDGFTLSERTTVRELFESSSAARLARIADPEGFTWVHGDLNPTNVLAPFSACGPVYLIDHQPFVDSPSFSWLGASDIAHAIVVWWPPELRRECERRLVEHWHATLVARGVRNYPLTKAWDDWRLCGLDGIYTPAGWCSEPEDLLRMRGLWEAQLRRVLAFAADHF